MKRIKPLLETRGYNLRERANVYAGLTMGALAPVVAARYMMFPSLDGSDNPLSEAMTWIASVVGTVGISLFAKGIPLLYSTMIGGTIGVCSAEQLQHKRLTGRSLEQVLQTD